MKITDEQCEAMYKDFMNKVIVLNGDVTSGWKGIMKDFNGLNASHMAYDHVVEYLMEREDYERMVHMRDLMRNYEADVESLTKWVKK